MNCYFGNIGAIRFYRSITMFVFYETLLTIFVVQSRKLSVISVALYGGGGMLGSTDSAMGVSDDNQLRYILQKYLPSKNKKRDLFEGTLHTNRRQENKAISRPGCRQTDELFSS